MFIISISILINLLWITSLIISLLLVSNISAEEYKYSEFEISEACDKLNEHELSLDPDSEGAKLFDLNDCKYYADTITTYLFREQNKKSIAGNFDENCESIDPDLEEFMKDTFKDDAKKLIEGGKETCKKVRQNQ